MNEVNECHEVMRQVDMLFENTQEEIDKVSQLAQTLREIEELKATQLYKLTEQVREFKEQQRIAEKQLVQIPSDESFQQLMEGMDEEKFSVAKSINSLESTYQNLQKMHTSIQQQIQLLQDVTDIVEGVSSMKLDMARAIPGRSAEFSSDIISRRPEVVQKVSVLGQIIRQLDANPNLVSSRPLRDTLESLRNPNKLRGDIEDLKHRHEYSSICSLLNLVANINWTDNDHEPDQVVGTIKSSQRQTHTFHYEASRYSRVFIANHLWDVVEQMEQPQTALVPRRA